jgi:hypothetical protein
MQVAFSLAVASPVAYPPILAVDSGVGAKVYASYVSGADTDVLTFKYLVVEDDNNPTFDVWDDDALETQGNGYLRRVSDLPSVDADVSLAAARSLGKSLGNLSAIVIDGRKPAVLAYGVANRTQADGTAIHKGNVTRVDDVVTVRVTWDKPVAVFGSPTLRIDASREREAVYAAGNGTRVTYFRYVVSVGDETDVLGVPATQAQITQGYSDNAFGGAGQILLHSDIPSVGVVDRLYFARSADKTLGNPLSYLRRSQNLSSKPPIERR